MVLGIAEQVGTASLPRTEQPSVVASHRGHEEPGVGARCVHPIVTVEHERGLGQRVEEQRVPTEQHLVVEAGPHALRPGGEQTGKCALDRRRTRFEPIDHVEDVAAEAGVGILEVAALGGTEVPDHLVGVVTAHLAQLGE